MTKRDAAYYRQYRAARGARPGIPGPQPTALCPSRGAWARHRRNPADVCACPDACRAAYNRYQADLDRNRRSTAGQPAAAGKRRRQQANS
jgi:hypothetical protein